MGRSHTKAQYSRGIEAGWAHVWGCDPEAGRPDRMDNLL